MHLRRSGGGRSTGNPNSRKNGVLRPVESLEQRLLMAVTAVTYGNPAETAITFGGAPVIAVDVGDVNGDGVSDFVALGGASALGLAFTARPFTGSSNGTFTG